MDTATITKLKERVEALTLEVKKKIPHNSSRKIGQEEFNNELYDFPECETDYLVSLAEQCLERVAVALSNKTGKPIFIYKYDSDFILFYFDSKYWKWKVTGSFESAMRFISLTENSL